MHCRTMRLVLSENGQSVAEHAFFSPLATFMHHASERARVRIFFIPMHTVTLRQYTVHTIHNALRFPLRYVRAQLPKSSMNVWRSMGAAFVPFFFFSFSDAHASSELDYNSSCCCTWFCGKRKSPKKKATKFFGITHHLFLKNNFH